MAGIFIVVSIRVACVCSGRGVALIGNGNELLAEITEDCLV